MAHESQSLRGVARLSFWLVTCVFIMELREALIDKNKKHMTTQSYWIKVRLSWGFWLEVGKYILGVALLLWVMMGFYSVLH